MLDLEYGTSRKRGRTRKRSDSISPPTNEKDMRGDPVQPKPLKLSRSTNTTQKSPSKGVITEYNAWKDHNKLDMEEALCLTYGLAWQTIKLANIIHADLEKAINIIKRHSGYSSPEERKFIRLMKTQQFPTHLAILRTIGGIGSIRLSVRYIVCGAGSVRQLVLGTRKWKSKTKNSL